MFRRTTRRFIRNTTKRLLRKNAYHKTFRRDNATLVALRSRYNGKQNQYNRHYHYSRLSAFGIVTSMVIWNNQHAVHAEDHVNYQCPSCKKLNVKSPPGDTECAHCNQKLHVESRAVWWARRGVRTGSNFVPFAGPALRFFDGVYTGNVRQVFRGALSFVGDCATAGGFSTVVENVLDYGLDTVELAEALYNQQLLDAFVIAVGLGFSCYMQYSEGAAKAKDAAELARLKNEARESVSNLARMVQRGGSVGKGVKIGNNWYRNLREAAYVRDAIVAMSVDAGMAAKEAQVLKELVEHITDVVGEMDLADTMKYIAGLTVTGWATCRSW